MRLSFSPIPAPDAPTKLRALIEGWRASREDDAREAELRTVGELERAMRAFAEVARASRDDEVIQQALAAVHPALDWEWLAADASLCQLVVRACGDRGLYPLIERLSALVSGPGLSVVSHLPALGHQRALARAIEVWGTDFSATRVRVGFVRGHLLELAFSVPGCGGHDDERALDAAIVYAESALGERVLDEWVGNIGVAPGRKAASLMMLGSSAAEGAPLGELGGLVERAREGLREGLPTAPHRGEREDWTLLEASPAELGEALSGELPMADVLMASTACPELVKCFLEGLPVSSARFSRLGERFCYLELPTGLPLQEAARARQALEGLLEAALGERAHIIGTATGTHRQYIILSVRELSDLLERLEDGSWHRGRLPEGSQLRFMDATWRYEWLALC
ncbi:MAG: hypothetical protein KIT72_18790 [Polyangiaceae bacterium]|nr:hypothetical protein [Polyangiaceae bacterium]MCW5792467.1 hypothetical protein [Polyangiaceae bacterium]